MPCYSLYLTNQPVVSHPTNEIKILYYSGGTPAAGNTANTRVSATWNINFSGMFKGEETKYRKCRIRVKTLGSLVGNNASFLGRAYNLVCSLSTDFNSPRTADKTLLGLTYGSDSPIGTAIQDIILNTMESTGVNINVPSGLQRFTMTFSSNSDPYSIPFVSGDFLTNFMLILELYDKIV
jgi:hypothetical protein